MDSDRFDELSKQFARPRSRRETLGLFGAAVAGLVFGRSTTAAPKADKPSKCYGGGSSCTNAKQCCSGICTNRRCEPEIPPECTVAADCTDPITDCQVHTCTAGVCGTENLASGTGCSTGICDGNGQCVECLTGTDCASGICENGACQPSCLTDDRLGEPCSNGVGACLRSGVFVCSADGLTVVCDAVAGTGSAEICNGIDDDCDGVVDEGAICPPPVNGTSACVNGNCELVSCNPGFADCDRNPANGCETNLMTSTANCGTCGRQCIAGPFSSAMCVQGNCQVTCFVGYQNCNGNPLDGCECPPEGECRGSGCCISNGAPAHPTIPCCGSNIFGICIG